MSGRLDYEWSGAEGRRREARDSEGRRGRRRSKQERVPLEMRHYNQLSRRRGAVTLPMPQNWCRQHTHKSRHESGDVAGGLPRVVGSVEMK